MEIIKKLRIPKCPYCKKKLVSTEFKGYYDDLKFWICPHRCLEENNVKCDDEIRGGGLQLTFVFIE